MNAIELKERIDFYMDTTRNGRFAFLDYNKAVNDAMEKFINDQYGDDEEKNIYSFDITQQVRDNLYTLIKESKLSPTSLSPITTNYGSFLVNHITMPTDYFDFISLQTLISNITAYARPTTYNELGPLLEDSFKMPTNKQAYYLEDKTGYAIYRGSTGTLSQVTLTYIKDPATFSIGNEGQLIGPGNNLQIGLNYIAIQESENNLVVYQPGQLFQAGSVGLVSGQVILASNTTACDLPEKTHNDIAKIAAAIMSGVISDYNRSQFDAKEAKQT